MLRVVSCAAPCLLLHPTHCHVLNCAVRVAVLCYAVPQELEPDTVALMAKRVYDVAGVLGKGCKVGQEVGGQQHTGCAAACIISTNADDWRAADSRPRQSQSLTAPNQIVAVIGSNSRGTHHENATCERHRTAVVHAAT